VFPGTGLVAHERVVSTTVNVESPFCVAPASRASPLVVALGGACSDPPSVSGAAPTCSLSGCSPADANAPPMSDVNPLVNV
jgi:hypothetical protein